MQYVVVVLAGLASMTQLARTGCGFPLQSSQVHATRNRAHRVLSARHGFDPEYHPRRLTRLRKLWDGFRLIKKCTCSKLSDGSGYPRCKQTNKSGLLDKYANQSRPRCTANLRIRPKPSLFTSGPPHLCWAQTRSPLRPRVLASPFRQELFVIMRAPTRAIARLPSRTLQ
jgi:hypothetical protein